MTKYPMTVQGARALEDELKHLKTELRPQITRPSPKRVSWVTSRRTPSTTPPANSRAWSRRGSAISKGACRMLR